MEDFGMKKGDLMRFWWDLRFCIGIWVNGVIEMGVLEKVGVVFGTLKIW